MGDPVRLVYPRQELIVTPRGTFHAHPDSLDSGSAQCLDLSVRESEGALAFFEDGIAFEADRGGVHEWSYEDVQSFSLRKSMLGLRKLTLMTGGRRLRFRIGHMLAANAECILTAAGMEKK